MLNPTTNVISGDFSENGATPSFKPIADLVLNEGLSNDIAVQANRTLVLHAPNWRFKPGTGSIATTEQTDISGISMEVTSEQIRITFSSTGTSFLDSLTISGLEVMAERYDPEIGRIRRQQTKSDTAQIAGFPVHTHVSYLSQTPPIIYAPLAIVGMTNECPILEFSVLPNINYSVQCSTDLQAWVNISTVSSPSNAVLRVIDTNSTTMNYRYYRLGQ